MAAVAAAFAGKAVATSTISYVVNKASEYLVGNSKSGGLKSTKERLERLVPQIQGVIDAVDSEEITNQSEALDASLWQFRDAVEEAEDALDELEYYKLEEDVKMRDGKVSGSLHKYKGKFAKKFNKAFNTGSLKRLRSAVKALDDVAVGVERFLHVINQFGNNETKKHKQDVDKRNSRETTSLPHSIVIGREEQRKAIVDWLTKSENRTPEQVVNSIPIFSIVGIGGLGKTTLAQVICNDKEVKKYFDLVIWVCVSHDFDVESLTRKILQGVTKKQINTDRLDSLHKALKEELNSKKFLLVLDDVWNDESVNHWETLMQPLRYGKRGSKILLTTRMKSVADLAARALQEECKYLMLSGLKETDLRILLDMHAFFGVDRSKYENLQEISKKITNKLSGSPLAAKVLGGLLNNKMDCRTWNRILALDIYNTEKGKEGIMKVLRLSYQHLPTNLQACFRYCSLFHKNYEFTKKELVYLWMGSGLIPQSKNNMMAEDTGMEYLDTLTRKSFFEVISRPRSSRDIKYCFFHEFYEERYIIHDLLNDLARYTSVKECIRVDRNFSEVIPVTVRHMSIEVINPTFVGQISQAKRLRTLLINFQEQDQAALELILDKVFSVAKCLQVLSLTTNSTCKLPDKFGRLVHLRYLSLVWSRLMTHFSWFPQSVYNLYHLQIMKFDDPQLRVPVKGEMDRFCNLVSLRHLQLTYVILPPKPYIGKLIYLQELYGFEIQQLSGYTIGELKNLKDISHLHISGLDKVKGKEEASEIMLNQKDNISAISLSWSPDSSDSCDPSKSEQLLHELEPHPNSCKLKIQGYPGSLSSCWLRSNKLINLTYLYLRDFHRLQRLPPIGQLPSLQYLYIINMKSVDRVDSSFYGSEKPYGLQSLRVLEIEDMPICTDWVGLEGENLFPRLERLVVRDCRELRQIPKLPISILYIEIHNAGLQDIPLTPLLVSSSTSSSSSMSLSLSKLEISCCPNLKSLWQGYSLNLSDLEELSIQQCVSLSCLPEDSLGSLSILENIEIVNCPNLKKGEIRWPPTVKWFTLGLCGDAEAPLMDSLQGLKSLRRLFLDGCAMPLLPSEVFACLTGLISMVFSDCAMTSLPFAEDLTRLENLENLDIWDCKQLVSLDGIQWLKKLSFLTILGCSSLVDGSPDQSVKGPGLSECALKLGKLDIDHPSLLLREPLRSIITVKSLQISGGPELTLLPKDWLVRNCQALQEIVVSNASHLQCLPQEMASLTSLWSLKISHANMLQALPNMPASLTKLHIENCHSELKKRCKNNVGSDWDKITHVADVDIY